jgi:hypothetical protein
MRNHYYFAVGLVLLVLTLVGFIFYKQGDPFTVSKRKYDQAILSRFDTIESAIDSYYVKNQVIPNSLEDLKKDYSYAVIDDKELGEFEYRKTSLTEYSLCATFKTASDGTPQSNVYDRYNTVDLSHKIGYDCIEYKVKTTTTITPNYDVNRTLPFTIGREGYCSSDSEIVISWEPVDHATNYKVTLYQAPANSPDFNGTLIDEKITAINSGITKVVFSSSKIKPGNTYFSMITSLDSTNLYFASTPARSSKFLCVDTDPQNKSASGSADAVRSYETVCKQSGGTWKNNTCDYGNCWDPDILDIYTKSTSTLGKSSPTTYVDYCAGDKLYESSCEANYDEAKEYHLKNQIFVCPKGCNNGACIP